MNYDTSLENILDFLWEPNIEIECIWKVSQQQFQHIKNILDSYKCSHNILSDELIYDNDVKVINTNTNHNHGSKLCQENVFNHTFIQKKTLLKSIHLNDYKIKASSETIITQKPKLFKLKRTKNRYRYNFNWFYIDITSVKVKNQLNNNHEYSYEIELELNIDICRSYNINNLSKYLSKQIYHINQII